jgi:hypothetical protein
MPADREPPTATDYVVTALSPVLVMLMVGSLVFFLVEVLYDGKYSGRLLYTLFFFVAGAVLIARVAIDVDPGRASVYGLLLGASVYAALLTYVEYPGGGRLKSVGWLVNLGLMALTWWSAHKLTWDCTHIDEKRKGAGRGLLSAAGLDADAGPPAPAAAANPERKRRGKGKKSDSRLWDWVGRYQKYREERRKAPHTPGVWVIYFALAALPLFALGQSLVSPDDTARRRTVFVQMAVYVGGALGLLVTTSLLGLRRYLRQRKAKIPTALAGGWLALGAVFIAAFLAVAAFLPRPHSEVPWFGIARAGSQDRDASKHALRKGGGAGKGEGAGGDQSKAGDGKASGKGGEPGGGTTGEKGGGGKGQDGKGGSGGKGEKGNGKGDPKGDGGGKGGKSGDEKKDENGDRGGGGEGSDAEPADGDGGEQSAGSRSDTQLGAALEKVAEFLKWVVFAVVAVLVVLAVVLGVLRYLAPFTDWARRLLDGLRNWWANLWGRKAQGANTPRSVEPAGPVRPPPFHTFSNPFADGTADGRDPAELAAYTFAALDSWAWDRGGGRDPTETPLEFAVRLIELFPDLAEPLARFAEAYAPLAYSDAPPPPGAVAALEEVWDAMVHGVAVG